MKCTVIPVLIAVPPVFFFIFHNNSVQTYGIFYKKAKWQQNACQVAIAYHFVDNTDLAAVESN